MSRLLAVLALVALSLAVVDQGVSELLDDRATLAVDRDRVDIFADVVFRSFEQANRSVNASISRAHRRYRALPDPPGAGEIRVFLIGNSAALFAIAPQALERRLAGAFPRRSVTLVPLLIPDLGVVDERLLVKAALDKGADLVVLTPNLKGLIVGRPVRMRFLRDLFGAAPTSPPLERPGDWLRRALVRRWQAYRGRDELREWAVERFGESIGFGAARSVERRSMEAAFGEIAIAAGRGDVAELMAIYRARGMERFIPGGLPPGKVPTDGPVFRNMKATAEQVRAAGARGVAIFLPVNPLFRDPQATRAHPEVRVHDATLRKLARRTLEVYQRAGFATADRLDAIPPEGFIDLVHPNARGMKSFSEQAARVTIRALRALERRDPGGA